MGNNGNGTNCIGLDKFYRQAIDALVAAAGVKDSLAEGHSERVRDYSIAIAKRLGCFSKDEMKNLEYAASLHDVGKVAVSSRILNKLGRLTEEEFRIMRQHSLVATRILEKIDGLQGAIPIIKHHHEHFDGDGYPDGLSGEDIPIGARIVAVAETYDILTSDVPWRQALTSELAIEEIERCSGTQFDPNVVSALRGALEDLGHPPETHSN
ncbi:MAG TPA: HD domain-containing phosphohydrolase [Armatimonadota bacterium]|jgi:HD-GYP domain-containing protein (c-di-GMP phosphodiesterase class II)|nr:HD domain-containing phosphohydrolase [Armatimonadota bacterium]HOP80823.1 HD domain-containing phosphohydrolase [Armatimonadota bacterium]HPP73814.1 HD domain-containing phosphohydrolase [Armatimonadota bacterium]